MMQLPVDLTDFIARSDLLQHDMLGGVGVLRFY